jgi:hypothetical protein
MMATRSLGVSRYGSLLLAACAAVAGFWVFSPGTGPERVMELPAFPNAPAIWGIRGGELLLGEPLAANRGVGLLGMPLDGGDRRELARDPDLEHSLPSLIRVTEDAILYRVLRRRPGVRPGMDTWYGVVCRIRPGDGSAAILLELELAEPRQLSEAAGVIAAGDALYWLQRHNWPAVTGLAAPGAGIQEAVGGGAIGTGSGYGQGGVAGARIPAAPALVPEPSSDLMAAPLDGRPARRLAADLKGNVDLVGIGDYVYLRSGYSPDSLVPADLQRFHFDDPGHVLLRDVPGPAPSFELDGRLYWLEQTGPRGISGAHSIVTTSRDGSDRRILFRMRPGARTRRTLFDLSTYRGRVYCILAEPQAAVGAPARVQGRLFFCQVHPDREDPLVKLCTLAPQSLSRVWFDGRCAYFAASEIRDDWWDWSPEGLRKRPVTAIYRYRLPN